MKCRLLKSALACYNCNMSELKVVDMVAGVKNPMHGDIGLARIGGILGFFVMLGQALAGDASRWTHTFIVLDDENVIAGQPGGARIDPLSLYKNKSIYVQMNLTDEKRQEIVEIARSYEGTPYGWLNYLAIGLARFNIKPKWLRRFIASNKTMMCSQLSDVVYCQAGIHIFNDGRLSGEVTPGDLANWIIEKDWIE